MGANNLGGFYKPEYHAFNNQRRFNQYIEDVSTASKLLLGPGIKKEGLEKEYEDIICYNSAATGLFIKNGVITCLLYTSRCV